MAKALENISTKGIAKYTPEVAFKEGLNIRKSLRLQPVLTKKMLCAFVMDLCQFVDAKRKLKTDEDII